jgi:hypothetical protein
MSIGYHRLKEQNPVEGPFLGQYKRVPYTIHSTPPGNTWSRAYASTKMQIGEGYIVRGAGTGSMVAM